MNSYQQGFMQGCKDGRTTMTDASAVLWASGKVLWKRDDEIALPLDTRQRIHWLAGYAAGLRHIWAENLHKAFVKKEPLRLVTRAVVRQGRGSVLGPDTTRRARWWDLTLSCGHHAERSVSYKPLPREQVQRGGTQHRSGKDVLPHPKRVRCFRCLADEAQLQAQDPTAPSAGESTSAPSPRAGRETTRSSTSRPGSRART